MAFFEDLCFRSSRSVPAASPSANSSSVLDRTEAVTFGTALRQALRSLALTQRSLADLLATPPGVLARLHDARVHAIGAEEEFRALKGGSRGEPTCCFPRGMRALGHRAADRWFGEHLVNVGVRSTVDLAAFAGPVLAPGLSARRGCHAFFTQRRPATAVDAG